jgi:hypothetical protein
LFRKPQPYTRINTTREQLTTRAWMTGLTWRKVDRHFISPLRSSHEAPVKWREHPLIRNGTSATETAKTGPKYTNARLPITQIHGIGVRHVTMFIFTHSHWQCHWWSSLFWPLFTRSAFGLCLCVWGGGDNLPALNYRLHAFGYHRTLECSMNPYWSFSAYVRKTQIGLCRNHTSNLINKRVFQNELYNFERLYKFIRRACSVFWTVIM